MSKEIVTPADEYGNCNYLCREDYDPIKGISAKCDYSGTCEYKSDKGKTNKKSVYTCNNFKKE